jgi:hypothetical protein
MTKEEQEAMKRILVILVLLLFGGIAGNAHDGAHAMKGTVISVDASSFTIVTPAKETHRIHFDEKTVLTMSGAPATIRDLKVGDRVVVEARDSAGTMHAMKVRFGKPAKAARSSVKATNDQSPQQPK